MLHACRPSQVWLSEHKEPAVTSFEPDTNLEHLSFVADEVVDRLEAALRLRRCWPWIARRLAVWCLQNFSRVFSVGARTPAPREPARVAADCHSSRRAFQSTRALHRNSLLASFRQIDTEVSRSAFVAYSELLRVRHRTSWSYMRRLRRLRGLELRLQYSLVRPEKQAPAPTIGCPRAHTVHMPRASHFGRSVSLFRWRGCVVPPTQFLCMLSLR